MSYPPIIELRANGAKPPFRDPIGTARTGFDQTLPPQLAEDGQVEIDKDHPVPRYASHRRDFRAIATLVQNMATKSQHVQRTLFIS